MDKPLVNKVANSGLETINLESYYPKDEIVIFDIKDFLFQGLILREKDFRKALKELEWAKYEGKILCVYCSSDAIIPVWAYMLVAAYVHDIANINFQGSQEEYLKYHYYKRLDNVDYSQYQSKRIIIKGCSKKPVPPAAYAYLTEKLKPYAQSIMYGEPCSTVPIFKRPRVINKQV